VSTPVCLTIGSSDSSGGAGVQGDIKAFASVGCYASTVIVGVTAQTPDNLLHRHTVPVTVVERQLDAVLDGMPCVGVKVGTTWSAELLELVGSRLRPLRGRGVPVVVDPVMVTAAGSWLSSVDTAAAEVARRLFPAATVLTPNRREAELLAGSDARTPRRELAERIVAAGARAVVITAGPDERGDWFYDGHEHTHIVGNRYHTGAEHGAGCAHSAALTGLLAHGWPLPDAVREAHRRASTGVLRGHRQVGATNHPVDLIGLADHAPVRDSVPPALQG
jgi:hydroxymethylpyrimidine/phosphomethylpyrimidine kinase